MAQIALAAASTASAVFSAGGVASFTFLGLSGGQALAASFLVRAALGYALNSLTTRPEQVSRGYTVNNLGPAFPHQIIYGETVVGGVVSYQALTTDSTTDDLLHRVISFAGHGIDSYQAIYVNGEEVTLDGSGNVTAPAKWVGLIRIKEHLGTDSQAADSDLVSEVTEWTSTHQGKGIAYLYARFKGASNFSNGVPIVTAKIRGRKVDAGAWDNNPSLCVSDYVTADFGLNDEASSIDSTTFDAAETTCDETVGSAKRYTINGAFLLDAAPEDILRAMISSMGGTFWRYGDKWALNAAEYFTPTITLTEDDLRGNVRVATRHSQRDNFNAVQGVYRGSETDWQESDYTEVSAGVYLYEDNNAESKTDLPLIFTDTDAMAQRIAKTFLRRNRFQVTVQAPFGLAALDVKIGDNVMLTFAYMGWTQKVFECVDWRLNFAPDGEIIINMLLREMDEQVFTGILANLQDESGNDLTDESAVTLEGLVA